MSLNFNGAFKECACQPHAGKEVETCQSVSPAGAGEQQ
eukprot:CAMPEP_0197622058 /NCGR_PEP_ID=MMETSP1338-20131121/2452_1 /TAXON_ID=43686 ORGANISM="Pelagodinium beii, Strain RCC1491" /NCGR_SAMPLE_ID=MMETSP1338 /ASSEMBLY_ACC=CAM_ASM_000754 /LENGTH=37 /DNA_ID= /DNA_START= /DNA_END= /DNA_ORIENTATION=